MNSKHNHNVSIFIGLGLLFGIIFDQLALGLCLGTVLGLVIDKSNTSNHS